MTDASSATLAPSVDTLLDDADPAPLFTPYQLGSATLANRFAMAPMTRAFSPGGVPSDDVVAYYARRAAHWGLLVTEGTYVGHPSAGSHERVPRFYGDDALAGWRRVVDAVHAEGGRIFPQLWHLGVARTEGAGPHPEAPVVSPSGLALDGSSKGESLSIAEIDAIVAAFATAAADAKAIGFDGVELHGAHGYLLDQFFWAETNRRADGYGGTLANRARIAAEIVAAVREKVGPDYPVMLRYSQWKGGHYDARLADTPVELEQLLAPVAEAGVTGFHVSTRRYWLPGFEGSPRTLAGWTKEVTGLPVIAIGSVGVPSAFRGDESDLAPTLSLRRLLELFATGEFDLVALGRAALAEPAWPEKLRSGDLGSIRGYDKSLDKELY